MKIYITRHGQTDWNTKWKLQGRTDTELNDFGREQARKTGEGLRRTGIRFDRVYSSPLKRALETAAIMSDFAQEAVMKDDRLIELSFGQAEGTTGEERKSIPELAGFDNFFTDPEKYVAKDGAESFESVLARTADFWENEIRPLEKEVSNILVVTHGGTLQSLLLHIDHRELRDYWKVRFPNCSMNLVSLKNGSFKLEWNSRLFY